MMEKLIFSKFDWSSTKVSRVIPLVYNYWLIKREKISKPLCRKYWPQTQSNDSNPHHVFRARDKERYRLRKQHRRNDMESFRYV